MNGGALINVEQLHVTLLLPLHAKAKEKRAMERETMPRLEGRKIDEVTSFLRRLFLNFITWRYTN